MEHKLKISKSDPDKHSYIILFAAFSQKMLTYKINQYTEQSGNRLTTLTKSSKC